MISVSRGEQEHVHVSTERHGDTLAVKVTVLVPPAADERVTLHVTTAPAEIRGEQEVPSTTTQRDRDAEHMLHVAWLLAPGHTTANQ